MFTNFVKSYPMPKEGPSCNYTTMVRHNGTVIAFAVNENRRILYSVLDLSNQTQKGPLDVNYWHDNPQELQFPKEIVTVGEGLFNPRIMPVYKKGSIQSEAEGTRIKENEKDMFRSTTANLSADAPIQVLSDNKYVYIFRQSHEDNDEVSLKAGVLLVDRFILSGTALLPKREVRYQRSRNKYTPQSRKDGLGAKDMEKQPFFEPTQKLEFIRNLKEGRFTALLLPTQIAGVQRWQIFTYNDKIGLIDSFNIERASDGLFNLKGSQPFTCPDHPEVFQLQSGHCPEPAKADPSQNCPRELVPILSKAGYAEWALWFDGEDDLITLAKPFAASDANYQAIEFWLKLKKLDTPQSLVSIPDENDAGGIVIMQGGTLEYRYHPDGDKNKSLATFGSGAALEPDKWSHVTLVREPEKEEAKGKLSWYINGTQTNSVSGIGKPVVPAPNLIFGSGPAGKFKGYLDEVRLWTRPRLQEEIAEDMHHRLIGHEPGLLLYWRFDEGSGEAVNDQTEHANHGVLQGEVAWEESDAPVGDHPGVRRTSFRFKDRKVVSGMTALLYYQQKRNRTGYDAREKLLKTAQEKPLKTNARVMLAVATRLESAGEPENNQNGTESAQNHIAVLDFGLSHHGKLAQIPDNIYLDDINPFEDDIKPGDRIRNSREIETESSVLEGQQLRLKKLISELEGNLDIPADQPFLDAAFCQPGVSGQEEMVFVKDETTIKWRQSGSPRYQVNPSAEKTRAMARWVYDNGDVTEFKNTDDGPSVSRPEPESEPELERGTSEWLTKWTAWENPGTEAAFAFENKYYYFKGNQYKVFDAKAREFSGPVKISEGEFPELWTDGVDAAAVHCDAKSVQFFKGLQYKSYCLTEEGKFKRKEAGKMHDVYPGVPFLFLHPEFGGNLPDLEGERNELSKLSNDLIKKGSELESARKKALEKLEVQVEMHMVHTDPFGLTTMGGLLTFAWTAPPPDNAPLLFDSANGKLALYFRGANDQFYVAYYDTMTETTLFKVPTEANTQVVFVPRMLGPVKDTIIRIENEEADTCKVTLQKKYKDIILREIWRHVPRSAAEFASVLNGSGTRVFLGRLLETFSDNVGAVKIGAAAPDQVKPGRVLSLGPYESPISEVVPLTALTFDGADDYLELPEPLIRQAGTIEMWLRFSDLTKNQTIFDASTKSTYFFIDIHNSELRFRLGDNKDKDFVLFWRLRQLRQSRRWPWLEEEDNTLEVDTLEVEVGTWHHLAAVWDFNSQKEVQCLYLDGKKISSSQKERAEGCPEFWNPFVGNSRSDYKTAGMFIGQIAEICIHNKPLTPQEVKASLDLGLFGVDARPLACCWRFRDVDGRPKALDMSNNCREGTLHGHPALHAIGILVKISPLKLPKELAVGEPVYTDYDYEHNTVINHRGREKRSMLFAVDASQAQDIKLYVKNCEITGSDIPSPMTHWIAYSQGSAMEFDGRNNDVKLKEDDKPPDFDKLPDLNAEGDLTLEAWLRPKPLVYGHFSTIVHHSSDNSRYLLGLQQKSAFRFNAPNKQYVEVPYQDSLKIDKAITVEAWVKHLGGDGHIVNRGGGWSDPGYSLFIYKKKIRVELQSDNEKVTVDSPCPQDREWHHIAFTWEHTTKEIRTYLDGELQKTIKTYLNDKNNPDPPTFEGPIGKPKQLLNIGRNESQGYYFNGLIGEVRLWNVVRSEDQIHEYKEYRLRRSQENLVGYWHFDEGLARDNSENKNHGIVYGTPTVTDSFLPGYAVTAGIGSKIEGEWSETYIQTKDVIPFLDWNHFAMVYNDAYALRFADEGAFLDCGNNATLDLTGDLTIELFFRVDDFKLRRGILTKGEINPAYALYVNRRGQIVFSFADEDGKEHSFTAGLDSALVAGQFYRIAVTRRHQSQTIEEKTVTVPEVEEWDLLEAHIWKWEGENYGRCIGFTEKYNESKPGSNVDKLIVGRASSRKAAPFKGFISEVRIWNRALGRVETCQNITGTESGLVAWWRLDENKGYSAEDATGANHASITLADWVRNPDPAGPTFRILKNGVFMETERVEVRAPKPIGFRLGSHLTDAFKGSLKELRIWHTARTQEQIQDNLFLRLLGEKEELMAYYTFDQGEGDLLKDHSLRGNDLTIAGVAFAPSDAPISHDTFQVRNALLEVKTAFHDQIHSQPGVQEYGDTQYDTEGNLIGVLKRCYSYIKKGQWYLVTGYKVGNLITEWIGQVQFNPELKGYIEGAPPVPSENLTAGPVNPAVSDYTGIASVEVVEAENVTYNYAASKNVGLNASFRLSTQFGVDTTVMMITAPLGIGTAQEIADVNVLVGLEGKFDTSAGWSSENAVGVGRNLTKSTKITLSGNWEDPKKQVNSAMRRRYQPANVGFALVQSETADVFALRLAHNLALVSYQFRPNPDIPKDWNIIPFPINPRYTKQGTLDGVIGYDKQGSKVLDPDYPNARDYGQHSYFKPKEAYALKNRIIKEEQELANYFRSVDPRFMGAKKSLAISAGLGIIGGEAGVAAGAITGLVSALETNNTLPDKLGKQNIVNTYVWSADGGFFSETTETMAMKQETTGGNFSFGGEVGAAIGVDFSVGGVDVSLGYSAMLGGSINLTKTKTKESKNSFRIDLKLDTQGDLQAYNKDLKRLYADGNPIIVPGKVDAYRFMTFYLEPNNENFDTFFNSVVDPIWLQGNQPNALALKQARQTDKKPPTWRVMHRVTFVSRILPKISDPSAPPLEKKMKEANIESNWQLIKKLEPFVRNKTANFDEFSRAIRTAIATYLPEMGENVDDIIQYLSDYYQVYEA